jgi:hypothetical protein
MAKAWDFRPWTQYLGAITLVAVTSRGYALRDLAREDSLALLETVPIGRVGLSIDALPVILPVNFILVDNWVVFRTVPGTKLDAAMARSVAAFEADDHAVDGSWGWSVLVRGYAHDMRDGGAIAGIETLHAWAFPRGEANHVVGIETTMVSGRRFGSAPAAATMLEKDGLRQM